MPVVTGEGLVGNVMQATDRRSVVRLITDPSFAVGVRGAGGRRRGHREGQGA